MRVFKYSVPLHELDDEVVFSVPSPVKILSAKNQNERLCIFILVQENGSPKNVAFRVAGTGYPIDGSTLGNYIDTVLFDGGSLVFHVFETLIPF